MVGCVISPAPYPATVRAKGWRFELDHERIEQSATWALASPEVRPWLLMLWLTAWKQTPCGSLEADDAVVCARIGMPPRMWSKHREILMRGWQQADDGRLYHQPMTELVLDMLARRRTEADRKALQRGKTPTTSEPSPADVPRDKHWTGPESDTGTDHQKREIQPPPTPRKRWSGAVHEFPPGFDAFWQRYPRKTAKLTACKAFARLRPDDALLAVMLAAIDRQALSPQWTKDGGEFIPHPATWLNGRRWEDSASAAQDRFAGAL